MTLPSQRAAAAVDVAVVGGGMAGCEAALQLARRGLQVALYEMRPVRTTEAHHTGNLGELVCSNSFRGDALSNAVGLLKEEMRRAGGALVALAERAAVPAGGALAVDRVEFARLVTEAIEAEPRIRLIREEIDTLPVPGARATIVATGPLTSPALAARIREITGEEQLYFYDSIAPIVDAESIDRNIVFAASRYGKGDGDDYLNCPLTRDEYEALVDAILAAELAPTKAFEEAKFFEACLPIEVMAARGRQTLRFGPMKPVGLDDPRTGRWPYAVVQLRTENLAKTAYNLVGFQTRMKWGDQKRVFQMIPGLGNAEFLRFGSVHRNTFIHAPRVLGPWLEVASRPEIRFAGQITGVEGYVESMACGLLAAWGAAAALRGDTLVQPPPETAIGGLLRHVTGENAFDTAAFQPSNVTWAMLPPAEERERDKRVRREGLSARALDALAAWGTETRATLEGFRKHTA